MNLLVVGAGEMGTWLGSHVESPTFTDRDPTAAERAAAATGGRTIPLDTDEQFDVVCLAVPIPAIGDAIADHADRATELVCDVSGVMGEAVTAMRTHAADRERCSLHPLFSAKNAPGRVAAVTDRSGPYSEAIIDALNGAGNEVFTTTAREHDEAMETVQAKAHAAVLAFALAGDDVDDRFHTDISAGLTELAARVTGGTPRVYADIQAAFDGADDIAAAAERIAAADDAAFERLYEEAGQ